MILRSVPPAYAPVSPGAIFARGSVDPGALEARLRDRFAADRAVLTGSGTQALRLAVRAALRLATRRGKPDGAVAIPAFTCYDVAAAVLAEASRVACYDVDPERLAPEPGSLANVLEAGASVVIVAPPSPEVWTRSPGFTSSGPSRNPP